MLSIFEKIEAAKIDFIDLLTKDDKIYCQRLFSLYQKHLTFYSALFDQMAAQTETHRLNVEVKTEDFYYAVYGIEKVISSLEDIPESISATLIQRIESYIKERYNIDFDSLQEKDGYKNIRFAISLETILENIVDQVGTDFIKSGKDQVRTKFQELFSFPSKQPELKTAKISLPIFFCLRSSFTGGEFELDYSDKSVNILLDALSLFLFNNHHAPDHFSEMYQGWKRKIDFSTSYELSKGTTIKFYKNRRLDISFASAAEAGMFWQEFQLEKITERN